MLSRERQARIGERLDREGKVVAQDLADEFAVSEDTIRRDLREMAAQGLCERVYGGALARPPALRHESFAQRRDREPRRKSDLARKAASFLEDGMTVFIDAGSTNIALAAQLPPERRLTLLTHCPAAAMAVTPCTGHAVHLIGGRYSAETGACLGSQTLSEIEALRPDLLVLGACGIDPRAGVTAFDPEDAAVKRCLGTRARSVMVLATADKLGTAAPFAVLEAGAVNRLVTDTAAGDAGLEAFRELGIEIIAAGSGDA
ncbi:DeoR/GlpR family DNA-binding transcription regulator [Jiella marina]|uniref:DeoR/GlpR family DNA-binding transcription regulator n=1 Tax=Jiella sp. LLJ827 TaxID=2917712 RepID=UPI0021015D32|nr:DeoR/GlpR family DNA-binding transcription regulator [Jiella sp. LLJ827]MCQ0990486.1 DeoR/GlpR family DNA-binding transcription regulator [Jiella sp. LLJ827]